MKSKEIKIKKAVIDKINAIVSEFIKQNSDLANVSSDEFIDAFIAKGGEDSIKAEFAKMKGHVNWSERQYKLLIARAVFEGVSEDRIEVYVREHADDFDADGGTLEIPPTLDGEMLIIGERRMAHLETEDVPEGAPVTVEEPTESAKAPVETTEPTEDAVESSEKPASEVSTENLPEEETVLREIENLSTIDFGGVLPILEAHYPDAPWYEVRPTANVLVCELERDVLPRWYIRDIIGKLAG